MTETLAEESDVLLIAKRRFISTISSNLFTIIGLKTSPPIPLSENNDKTISRCMMAKGMYGKTLVHLQERKLHSTQGRCIDKSFINRPCMQFGTSSLTLQPTSMYPTKNIHHTEIINTPYKDAFMDWNGRYRHLSGRHFRPESGTSSLPP